MNKEMLDDITKRQEEILTELESLAQVQ